MEISGQISAETDMPDIDIVAAKPPAHRVETMLAPFGGLSITKRVRG